MRRFPRSPGDEIDAEATRTLKTLLAARRLVDFKGPARLGSRRRSRPAARKSRRRPCRTASWPVCVCRQPLVEIRVPFELSREELEAIERGARRTPTSIRFATRRARPQSPRIARYSRAIRPRTSRASSLRPRAGAGDSRRITRRIRTSSPRPHIDCAVKVSAVRTESRSDHAATPASRAARCAAIRSSITCAS